ncbi:MAG: enoyl-CoA hydratase-related protein [candidate division Zixibacteria bacterium]
MADKILSESLHDGQVVRLTLNAPKANVVDSAMMTELQAKLDGLKSKPEVKLVQFIGSGDNFSFGASVEEHTKENAPAMLKQFHQLFYSMAELAIPTAAIVSGQCLGGGLELALMCNFMFVDATAKLGQPEIMLGVFAPPASVILPVKIGQSRADDLLLTGRTISASKAVEAGLALAPAYDDREAMLDEVDKWVQKRILPKSASSLRFGVRAARMHFNAAVADGLARLEKFYVTELMESADANEGITSFLEKRKPVWKNN